MRLLVKIILGLSSSILVMATIIALCTYFIRKAKNESLSTGSLSNTTISSTIDIESSTTMFMVISVTASTMVNTTISFNVNATTTTSSVVATENMTNDASTIIVGNSSASSPSSTSMVTVGNSSAGTVASSSAGTVGSSSIATTGGSSASTVASSSSGITSSILTVIAGSSSAGTVASSLGGVTSSKSTATTRTTSSSVCLFGFEPMVPYWPDSGNFLGPVAVDVGYFDNDNYLDVVVANYDDQSVGILHGNGDGTFQSETTFFAGNNTDPIAMAVGDFNNDNNLDAVIVNTDNGNIVVFLGDGGGILTPQMAISTGSGSYPAAVVVGYFNKDNILDLAVANSGNDRVVIFMGNGNGTFQNLKSLQAGGGSSPSGVAVGDFNHDNNTDVAGANWGTNQVGVFLGYGNGSFRSQITFLAGNSPTWVNVADFNGDGQLDIAVLNMGDNNIGILLGVGNGSFLTQTTYSVSNTNSTYSFSIADANNDGRLDILIPNSDNDNIGILLGRGDGTFGVQITFSCGSESAPAGLVVADFNSDNRADIAVANYYTDNVGIFLGTCIS